MIRISSPNIFKEQHKKKTTNIYKKRHNSIKKVTTQKL